MTLIPPSDPSLIHLGSRFVESSLFKICSRLLNVSVRCHLSPDGALPRWPCVVSTVLAARAGVDVMVRPGEVAWDMARVE